MKKILEQHFLDSSVICCFLSHSKWRESFSRDSLESDSSWINLTHRIKYHGSNGLVPNFPTGFNVSLWPLWYYKSGSNFLCLYSRSFDILPTPVCTIKGFIISCQWGNYNFGIPIMKLNALCLKKIKGREWITVCVLLPCWHSGSAVG